jgi:HPt (histidine-containing phosphotransfer) domain-containing protein
MLGVISPQIHGDGMDRLERFDTILDLPALDELHQLLGADLCDIVAQLLVQLPAQFEALSVASAAGDFVAIRSIAHNIKGSVGNMGGVALSKAVAALEGAAREHDSALVARQMEQVTELVPETLAAFEAFVCERCGD